MSKFTKVVLIMAAIVMVIGIACAGIGFAFGGFKQITSGTLGDNGFFKLGKNLEVGFNGLNHDFEFGFISDNDHAIVGNGLTVTEYDASVVNGLSISGGACDISVKVADVDTIQIDASGLTQNYEYGITNGVFTFSTNEDEKAQFFGITSGLKAEILIPKDVQIVDLGVELGAGNLELDGIDATNVNIDCGAGNVNSTGTFSGNIDVDCGMGNVSMYLAGSKADYNFDIDYAMGAINLGGDTSGSIGGEYSIDNGSDKEVDIDCAMGNVDILFK